MKDSITRREAIRLIGVGAAGLLLPKPGARAESTAMLTRAIPSSGEKLSVIGLGTARVFDIAPAQAATLEPVLTTFGKLGGKLIDSSPMYGHAEEVIGDLVAKTELRESLFLATKVWTRAKHEGTESMERSLARLQSKKIDLMQVHNLVDTETQLATMREWKAEGKIRYLGVTHYEEGAFPAIEKVLRSERLDFVQINYSILERDAEKTILPLAQERGVAVLINRPFGAGDLFARVNGKPLPDFAREFDCDSWAQFFLKWIIAHPAVTCTIPATNNVRHVEDNMRAGTGKLPDLKIRQRMVEALARI